MFKPRMGQESRRACRSIDQSAVWFLVQPYAIYAMIKFLHNLPVLAGALHSNNDCVLVRFSLGFSLPSAANPADFLLDVLSGRYSGASMQVQVWPRPGPISLHVLP
jgi:hypothetical protein